MESAGGRGLSQALGLAAIGGQRIAEDRQHLPAQREFGPLSSMLIAQEVDQLHWSYAACLSATLLATTLAIMAVFQKLFGVGAAFRSVER